MLSKKITLLFVFINQVTFWDNREYEARDDSINIVQSTFFVIIIFTNFQFLFFLWRKYTVNRSVFKQKRNNEKLRIKKSLQVLNTCCRLSKIKAYLVKLDEKLIQSTNFTFRNFHNFYWSSKKVLRP